ncbi:DUF2846 domain-containing protein [Cupriavidus sp. 2MCAB6]|uniref:DUF2846 domain-containing protein n=1 Tax=Cupriavidus sp. 2MCAB6 TaxID=3232981 RepID=UPI003F92442C
MKRVVRMVIGGMAISFLMAGCASGVKHSEMAASIPTIKPGEGRIYFLRSASMFGAAIQPDLRLNSQVVGESKPGGFFFVDRPAGKYVASASTETEKTLSFVLDGGETKYVRSSPSIGLMVGRVVLELETPDKAKEELSSLSYTGDVAKTSAK